MEVKTYNLTKETSAFLTCIETATRLQEDIIDALELTYNEGQIALSGGEDEKNKIGYDLFTAIRVVL